MLYRPTDRLCRRGAPMKNLTHSASFDSGDKDAPSKPGIKQLAMSQKFSEVLLIAKDESGESRLINLSGVTIEMRIPAPSSGDVAELERRLAEAREGLQFYADPVTYKRQGRGKSEIQNDSGDIARDTLTAIRESE